MTMNDSSPPAGVTGQPGYPAAAQVSPAKLFCGVCGIALRPPHRRWCSYRCTRLGYRKTAYNSDGLREITCPNCGTEFQTLVGRKKFCTASCANKFHAARSHRKRLVERAKKQIGALPQSPTNGKRLVFIRLFQYLEHRARGRFTVPDILAWESKARIRPGLAREAYVYALKKHKEVLHVASDPGSNPTSWAIQEPLSATSV